MSDLDTDPFALAVNALRVKLHASPRSGRAGHLSTTLVCVAGLGQVAQETILLTGDLIDREHAEQEHQLHGEDAEVTQADRNQDADCCAEPSCFDRAGYPEADPCT